MKGKVFIGWTVDTSLAMCVKNELKKYDFYGECGGLEGNNQIKTSVQETIVSQMDQCSSAIMLFAKRNEEIIDNQGNRVCKQTLSPNMLYELGYLTASLNNSRVISFYIDGAEDLVPSDIKGGWQVIISTEGKDNEQIAKEIVDNFMQRQCNLITGNKMDLMTDISKLRNIIREHIAKPIYYETEIAYIVLLLSQASYMHDEMITDRLLIDELLSLCNKRYRNPDNSLMLSINSTFDYFTACSSLEEIEFSHSLQLPRKAYKKLRRDLTGYVNEAEDMDDCQFKSMFLMIAYDYLTFINMMHYGAISKDEIDEDELEFREQCALKSLEYAEKFTNYDIDSNEEIACLYKSYTLRNLAIFYRAYDRHDEAQERFEESIEVRKKLYNLIKKKNLNKSITEQIKMEYYLSLKDNLPDVDYSLQRKRIKELRDYIEEVNEVAFNRRHLISEIERVLNEVSKNLSNS